MEAMGWNVFREVKWEMDICVLVRVKEDGVNYFGRGMGKERGYRKVDKY